MKNLTNGWQKITRKFEELENRLNELENKLNELRNGLNKPENKTDNMTILSVKEIRQAERKRIAEIEAFAEKFAGEIPKLKEKSYEAIKSGVSAKKFRHYIFLIRQRRLKF